MKSLFPLQSKFSCQSCRFLFGSILLAGLIIGFPSKAATPSIYSKSIGNQFTDASSQNLSTSLAAVEARIEQKRQELGVPGMSLVIVKDDKVIYLKGFGQRDVDLNLPVTPDTLFEIGSTTKAFTGMATMMTVGEGKMSLDDSPKKYLPYFKMLDPEADAKVTLRDLLSHRTGLKAYEDDVWIKNPGLSRAEVIQRSALRPPTARFREKYQYNNVMYSAVGEAIGKAQNSTWEEVISNRILRPLKMNSSAPLLRYITNRSNLSRSYNHGFLNGDPTRAKPALRLRDMRAIAPAAGIVSNARDMSQWLRLMSNGGSIDGKRLVSQRGFNEIISKQVIINPQSGSGYGLGWGVSSYRSQQVIFHTGSTPGFSSKVVIFPTHRMGFALLFNVPLKKSNPNFAAPFDEIIRKNLVSIK